MILTQVFKTGDGASKRATFETRHSKTHVFRVIRFIDGRKDDADFSRENWSRYTWRLEKIKRS